MLCSDIMKKIETTYPKHAALEWDNVGLLVGRERKEVKKIFVALDATEEVIEAAIATNADMLVTHHPLLFSPVKTITDEDFVGRRVVKLLQHDISYYAMHTNYDVLGMAKLSGDLMELTETEALEVTEIDSKEGIGKVGNLTLEMTLGECAKLVKEKFRLESVKVYGDLSSLTKRVAICPGSGKGMSSVALEKGADVLITGDISYHEGIDAIEQGLAIIDAGHYGLEHIFISDITSYLKNHLDEVDIEGVKIVHPFQTI